MDKYLCFDNNRPNNDMERSVTSLLNTANTVCDKGYKIDHNQVV